MKGHNSNTLTNFPPRVYIEFVGNSYDFTFLNKAAGRGQKKTCSFMNFLVPLKNAAMASFGVGFASTTSSAIRKTLFWRTSRRALPNSLPSRRKVDFSLRNSPSFGIVWRSISTKSLRHAWEVLFCLCFKYHMSSGGSCSMGFLLPGTLLKDRTNNLLVITGVLILVDAENFCLPSLTNIL